MPAWLAVIVVVPTPTIVTVLPLTVATAVFALAYVTLRPDDAVAPSVNAAAPYVFATRVAKVMVWLAGAGKLAATFSTNDAVPAPAAFSAERVTL